MRYWVAFLLELGLLTVLTGAFHTQLWSAQWWAFLIGSLALGTAVSLIVGKKKS